MSLITRLKSELKSALLAKDSSTATTLRMLLSAIKNQEIAVGSELPDDKVLAIVKTEVKKVKDSIQQFTAAGRNDLVKSEQQDLAVLEKYLPEQMPEDEVRRVVETVISETSAQGMKDMGRVIGVVMGKHGNEADGAVVSKIVKEELSKL